MTPASLHSALVHLFIWSDRQAMFGLAITSRKGLILKPSSAFQLSAEAISALAAKSWPRLSAGA